MPFDSKQVDHLRSECETTIRGLQHLQLRIVVQGQPLDPSSRLREHLLHGAARRVGVIRRSIQNVFTLFPPDAVRPLSEESVADVQINLHAFVMNLYGLYDNWAWAFVLRHCLEAVIGDRRRIGLFSEATRRHLPQPLRAYLSSAVTTEWHEQYAKSFRDALAHRIPPYLPPAQFSPEEGALYNALESEKVECIKSRRWARLDEVYAEQTAIGKPCFVFLHAYNEDTPPKPLLLHPQMLSDGKAVLEFGELFLAHWHSTS